MRAENPGERGRGAGGGENGIVPADEARSGPVCVCVRGRRSADKMNRAKGNKTTSRRARLAERRAHEAFCPVAFWVV